MEWREPRRCIRRLRSGVDQSGCDRQSVQPTGGDELRMGVTHQVEIVSTGTRNASSTDSKVDYDAIVALK